MAAILGEIYFEYKPKYTIKWAYRSDGVVMGYWIWPKGRPKEGKYFH